MGKNVRLADIYIKIYNKRPLTMEDLTFLSKYDWEEPMGEKISLKKENMELLLDNLRKMETKEISVQEVKADKVKNLLGSLYMEMLFPHNDKNQYFEMEERKESSVFNKKV